MLKMEYLEGRKVIEKEINLNKVINLITQKLDSYSTVKTIFEIPSLKGIGLHQATKWEQDDITCGIFQNNLVISDNHTNSLAINEKANILIMDRNNILTILFKDCNFSFIIESAK